MFFWFRKIPFFFGVLSLTGCSNPGDNPKSLPAAEQVDSTRVFLDRWFATRGVVTGAGGNSLDGGTRKLLTVAFMACLKEETPGHFLAPGRVFEIVSEGKESAGKFFRRELQDDRCLYWEDQLEFDQYGQEQWLEKAFTLKSVDSPAIVKTVKFLLNPWQFGVLFFWDDRSGAPIPPPSAISLVNHSSVGFEITQVSSSFVGQQYSLDARMELVFNKFYQVRIQPVIRRMDLATGFPAYLPIPDGTYQMRLTVLASPQAVAAPAHGLFSSAEEVLSKYKYLAGSEPQTVEARNGSVIAHVSFPFSFQDLPWLANRNELLVEFASLGQEPSPSPAVVAVPFAAVADGGTAGAVPLRAAYGEITQKAVASDIPSISRLMDLGQSRKKAAAAAVPDDAVLGIRPVGAERLQKVGITSRESEIFLSGARSKDAKIGSVLRKFCRLTAEFQSQGEVKECETAPSRYFKVTRGQQVRQVRAEPVLRQTQVSMISMSAGMSVDQSSSNNSSSGHSKSKSIRNGLSAKAGLNLWFFSVGADKSAGNSSDWFNSEQVSHSTSNGSHSSISFGKTLMVEEMEFSFEAETMDCVYLTPSGSISIPWSYRFCSEQKSRTEKITESWFYISQALSGNSSPMRDGLALADTPWIKLIRGRKQFEKFKQIIENQHVGLVLSRPAEEGADDRKAGSTLEKLAQKFTETHPLFSDGAIPSVIFSE